MSDPYRAGFELACPTCERPLLLGDTHHCPDGCGEWIDAKLLVGCELGGGWTDRGGPCAYCKRPMEYVSWNWVVFLRCPPHGVWVAEAQSTAFHGYIDRNKIPDAPPEPVRSPEEVEIDRLVDQPRELASRVIALERALAELRDRR